MAHIGSSKNGYPHHHSLDPVSRLLQWQHTRLKRLCATSESTDRPRAAHKWGSSAKNGDEINVDIII